MARGVNKVILIGNLGSDPEVRYTPEGRPVANFSLATSESWNDRNTGERQERTEWHRLVLWSKLAEIAGQYLKKGAKIYVEGRLQTRSWDDQSGQKRYTTEIVVNDMQMLDSRGEGGGSGGRDTGYNPPGDPSGGQNVGPALPALRVPAAGWRRRRSAVLSFGGQLLPLVAGRAGLSPSFWRLRGRRKDAGGLCCRFRRPGYRFFPPAARRSLSHRAHLERCGDFLRALIQGAASANERAFAAGWGLHVYADMAVHPWVEARVAALLHEGTRPAVPDLWHMRLEWGIDCRLLASEGMDGLWSARLHFPRRADGRSLLGEVGQAFYGRDADESLLERGEEATARWLQRIPKILWWGGHIRVAGRRPQSSVYIGVCPPRAQDPRRLAPALGVL